MHQMEKLLKNNVQKKEANALVERKKPSFELKKKHFILLMKQKHRLKMNGQNIIQITLKMEDEYITDVEKSDVTVVNAVPPYF